MARTKIAEVRGYADQRLRKPEDPNSVSNRQVSLRRDLLDAAP
jgi:hypothetical protein